MSGQRSMPAEGPAAAGDGSAAAIYAAALENLPDAIAIWDDADRLVLGNRLFRILYALPAPLCRPGTPRQTILDHLAVDGGFEPGGLAQARRAVGATGTVDPEVVELTSRDGRVVEVRWRPLAGGGWVSTHCDVTESRRVEERTAFLASHDALTGFLDLPTFHGELGRRLADLGAGEAPFAVVRLNISGFRRINETYGHAGGDAVLVEMAARIALVGPSATPARVGADEFAIIVPLGEEDLGIALEILRRSMSRPHRIGAADVTVPVSIGYAVAPEHGDSVAVLMRRADAARMQALCDGGWRSVGFDWPLEHERQVRLTLAHDILPGIDSQEFVLAYQPIVEMASGRLVGAEALLRWIHPDLGPVRPDLVVSVAEEYGRIGELGEWVLRSAAAAARHWRPDIAVSVNVSGVQMRSRGFTRLVRSVLKDTGLDPRRLVLEVTESTVLVDRGARSLMDRVADLGIRFALDDFGTGFASLHYLVKYPFHRIKVDRGFVAGLTGRPDCQAIVRSIIEMAERLGKDVVVEGVEQEEERALIASWGKVNGQGYLFSQGLLEAEFLELAASGRTLLR